MANKNELLKDIAVKLGATINKPNNTTNELLKIIAQTFGATVTEKDNDVNELLTLIRDNMDNGDDVDGIIIFEGTTDDKTEVFIPIIKNYYTNKFVGNAEIISE